MTAEDADAAVSPQRAERRRMRVVVLMNEAAGALSGHGVAAEMARIGDALRAAGVEAEVRAMNGGGVADAARAALGSDRPDAIVVAGGDGSVSAAVQVLAGTDTPLGVLPLGTFNHFAKDAGIPLDLDDAARAIAGGAVRTIDLAEVNGRPFVDNSVLGAYAHVVQARDMQRKRLGRNRWLALFRATAGVLRRFPMLDVGVGDDAGRTVWRRTAFVFVGNNDYELPLYPSGGRSSLEGGRLSVYVATPTGRARTLAMALRALVSRRGPDDLLALHPREVVIRSWKRRLRVVVDGEVVSLQPPLAYRIRPHALRVLVPPPADDG